MHCLIMCVASQCVATLVIMSVIHYWIEVENAHIQLSCTSSLEDRSSPTDMQANPVMVAIDFTFRLHLLG